MLEESTEQEGSTQFGVYDGSFPSDSRVFGRVCSSEYIRYIDSSTLDVQRLIVAAVFVCMFRSFTSHSFNQQIQSSRYRTRYPSHAPCCANCSEEFACLCLRLNIGLLLGRRVEEKRRRGKRRKTEGKVVDISRASITN